MNDPNISCADQLSDVHLEEYVRGDLDLENSKIVAEHLSVCADCYQRYVSFTAPSRHAFQKLLDELSGERYELKGQLAEGGQGRVYLALDRANQATVVIKHFCSANTLSLFGNAETCRNEFQNSKRVLQFQQSGGASSGIAQVYELFEDDSQAVLVREYIEGVTLESKITSALQQRSLTELEQIADWLIEVGEVVHDAHRIGILHGDLKPANIMIRESGSPVLIDFGISFDRRELGIRSEVRAGTLNYMAPEVVRQQSAALSPRCEVWSLGVMLYQLLNGGLPFDISRQSNTTKIVESMETGILFPSINTCSASRDLQLIINKCLAPVPEERYANAREFADALRAWRLQQELNALTATPPKKKTRPLTAMVLFSVMLVNIICVMIAYSTDSMAWTLKFNRIPLGRTNFDAAQIGLAWDCLRQIVLIAALGYLIEIPFRDSFDRFFLFQKRSKAVAGQSDFAEIDDTKLVLGVRILWLVVTIVSLVLLFQYHWNLAPEKLAQYAEETLGSPDFNDPATRSELTPQIIEQLKRETPAGDPIELNRLHRVPYLWYMSASLVNFAGIGTILLAVCCYASLSDIRAIFRVKKIVDRNLEQAPNSVEVTFKRFRRMCRDRSQKYLLLAAIFPGWTAIELYVQSVAEEAGGWSFIFLPIMLSGVFIWIFCVTWYYSEIFDACRKSQEDAGMEIADWSKENSPAAFLGECFLGTLAGRAVLLSITLCIFLLYFDYRI